MTGQRYSLEQAQAMLPEARERAEQAGALVTDLQRLVEQLRSGTAPSGAVEEAASLEAEVEAIFGWFEAQSVQVKSLAPILLDFPARAIRDGEAFAVLLCWRDDEPDIAYYHPPSGGYRAREPVAMLDRV